MEIMKQKIRKAEKRKKAIGLFLLASLIFLILNLFVANAVEPFGAGVNSETPERAAPDSPQGVEASAGNVTELNINGYSLTQAWQGYFGEVTGTIMLADAGSSPLYNWSLASPRGEVYASTSNDVAWEGISCFNLTQNGAALETTFGISSEDSDGLDETFSLNDHQSFFTNSKEFEEGQCNNVKLFGNGGVPIFDEVLLTDGINPVFTSILRNNEAGFDGAPHDFEMLVLENGHGTNTKSTTYYFYVELE